MKRILGLDLGTTSIGWALVNEAEKDNEKSEIIRTGVRIIQYDNFVNSNSGKESKDPVNDFNSGNGISTNAGRTQKRGARRSLQRYKLRRAYLIKLLQKNNILDDNRPIAEDGKESTKTLWEIRAKAANQQIDLHDFARVLLAINKKRGYKSNRKAKQEDEGQAIDGLEVAKILQAKKITPGEYTLGLLEQDKKQLPDFYPSDLNKEFKLIWKNQQKFYPEILTNDLFEQLKGQNKNATWKICEKPFNISGSVKFEGNAKEKNIQLYQLRVNAITAKLTLEKLAVVLQEINNQINKSSGYLGAISDRSKALYFNNQTVGEYLTAQLQTNQHAKLKNQVFYRQNYLDEFNKIWEVQSKTREHLLTNELKEELRDVIIFYQRKLKSQKGLISICELEGTEKEIIVDGKTKKKIIGPRVAPKSSPLFQEFKIWQILNNLKLENLNDGSSHKISDLDPDAETRKALFEELNVKGKLTSKELLKNVVQNPKDWELKNFKTVEGNNTNASFYKAFEEIINNAGHDVSFNNLPASEVKKTCKEVFGLLGIETAILNFNTDLDHKNFEAQKSFQLWHLLYSYEGDTSNSGNESLYKQLKEKFGFEKQYAEILANITLQDDYGNLSSKAMRKILPFLKAGHEYSEAATYTKYNHSHSITATENKNRVLKECLELLPKNSLRNPVVEKILNQLVNVVNAIIDTYGKPHEIRIELARELKKSAKERKTMSTNIFNSTKENDNCRKEIEKLPPFNNGVRITKNDLVKYRLWKELEHNGHKTIYTNTFVPIEKLFTNEFDVEHIIPKAVLFDDSFSNKTLSVREFNRWKGSKTAIDAIAEKYGEESIEFQQYLNRVNDLKKANKIGYAKFKKLLITAAKIPDGFIERDLRNSQYIAKKATEMLLGVVRNVSTTTGSITDKLRQDWQLVNTLQELNWDKYNKLGLTYYEKNKEGKNIPKIEAWTKRNDHRHHAMDALTVAFTKPSLVQYLNYLNARRDEKHKFHKIINAIQQKETYETDKGKRLITPPMPIIELRAEAKRHLEATLISFKAKNKVVTKNKNVTKTKNGTAKQITLTPRGQLHKETIYGQSHYYESKEEKVGTKFTVAYTQMVAKKRYREALLKRLAENDNDPKKAFGGKNALSKTPIHLNKNETEQLPEKVKITWKETRFTIRKDVTPDNFKDEKSIKKVIDVGIRNKLMDRLNAYGGNGKLAFANLEKDPIWLNKDKGICIKTVKISGVSNAEPLHLKKDHFGKDMLDKNGKPVPNDYVSTGNNHHVAIYIDANGKLQEKVVSFFEAVAAKNADLEVINYNLNHHLGWKFLFTLKQNEYFVFPNEQNNFDPKNVDLLDENNYHLISPNLFRVQKIATKNYFFRHHLETQLIDKKETKLTCWINLQSLGYLRGLIKVHVNHIGKIVHVGEFITKNKKELVTT